MRAFVFAIAIGLGANLAVSEANAAAYCARYVGATSDTHAHCGFATLEACRASVRARGGGHCYAASMR